MKRDNRNTSMDKMNLTGDNKMTKDNTRPWKTEM